MTKIINVSMEDVRTGSHENLGDNAIIIQITDPNMYPPVPDRIFKERYTFQFLDAEDHDPYDEEYKISDKQANELIEILERALAQDSNVLVHCVAGVCRSGAVVEVGEAMGFELCRRHRNPNLRVKHKMLRILTDREWSKN